MIGWFGENSTKESAMTDSQNGDRSTAMARLAERIGCTEGQLYTMIIGLVLAIVLAIACIPTSLRHHHVAGPLVRGSHVVLTTSG